MAQGGMAAVGAQAVAATAEVCAVAAWCTSMKHALRAAFRAWGSMLTCQPAWRLDAYVTPALVLVGCSMLTHLLRPDFAHSEGSLPGKCSMLSSSCTSKVVPVQAYLCLSSVVPGAGKSVAHCVQI